MNLSKRKLSSFQKLQGSLRKKSTDRKSIFDTCLAGTVEQDMLSRIRSLDSKTMEPYYKNANNSKLFSDINVEIEEFNVVVNPEVERHTIQDISSERFQKRGTLKL